MQLVQTNSRSDWPAAFFVGSLLNFAVFFLLPGLGNHPQPLPPPEIIELEFMPWQAPRKVEQQKPAPQPPKPQPKPKPKPKPTETKPVPKPKPVEPPKPVAEPVLTEKPAPEEITPPPKERVIEEPPPTPQIESTEDTAEVAEETLPIPAPLFELTELPRLLHGEQPVYPPSMKSLGKEGRVRLEVLVDTKGKVRQIRVVKSAGSEFDQAAIDATASSIFSPGKIEGRPVAVLYKMWVKFSLK